MGAIRSSSGSRAKALGRRNKPQEELRQSRTCNVFSCCYLAEFAPRKSVEFDRIPGVPYATSQRDHPSSRVSSSRRNCAFRDAKPIFSTTSDCSLDRDTSWKKTIVPVRLSLSRSQQRLLANVRSLHQILRPRSVIGRGEYASPYSHGGKRKRSAWRASSMQPRWKKPAQ